MTANIERAEQRKALEEFANSGAQPNQPQPSGHALVRPTASLTPIGAQPVAQYRDEAKVLQKLSALAAAAGSDWFYRFPVRTAEGGQDWIEGPSIKLANDIARVFGNCIIEVRELDVGDAFVFYARFSDIETGFSMERAYRQRKGQRTFKSKDADRQLDILYQIGQSKAIRNVIVNSLQIYSDYAFEQARNSLTDKIGKDIQAWRDRTVKGLARVPVELKRVERVVGRAAKDWLAPDIARIVAMMRAIADGMGTVDETFPPDQTIIEKAPPSPPSAPAEPHGEVAPASPVATAEEPAVGKPGSEAAPPAASTAPKNFAEYQELVQTTCHAAASADELMKWFRSEPQRRLRNACGLIAEETQVAKALVEARVKELQQQT
jgi:hypothetical protein